MAVSGVTVTIDPFELAEQLRRWALRRTKNLFVLDHRGAALASQLASEAYSLGMRRDRLTTREDVDAWYEAWILLKKRTAWLLVSRSSDSERPPAMSSERRTG